MEQYPKIGLVVDGSTRGNPGLSQYQIYDLSERKIVYQSGYLSEMTTNNICEFLALCTGIYLSIKKSQSTLLLPVYSDSQTAISWVKNLEVKTTSNSLSERISKAIDFITDIRLNYDIDVKKWITPLWGENPADFGIKK